MVLLSQEPCCPLRTLLPYSQSSLVAATPSPRPHATEPGERGSSCLPPSSLSAPAASLSLRSSGGPPISLLAAAIYQLWGIEDYSSWLTATLSNPASTLILAISTSTQMICPKPWPRSFFYLTQCPCPPPCFGYSHLELYSSHVITNNHEPSLTYSLVPPPISPSLFWYLNWTENPSLLLFFNCLSAPSSPHFSLLSGLNSMVNLSSTAYSGCPHRTEWVWRKHRRVQRAEWVSHEI